MDHDHSNCNHDHGEHGHDHEHGHHRHTNDSSVVALFLFEDAPFRTIRKPNSEDITKLNSLKEQISRDKKEDAELLFEAAQLSIICGQDDRAMLEEAKSFLQKAISLNSSNEKYRLELASLMLSLHEEIASIEEIYIEVIKMNQKNASTRQIFSDFLRRFQSNYKSSEKHIRMAVQQEPQNAIFHLHLGYLIRDQATLLVSKPDQAIARLNEAVSSFRKSLDLDKTNKFAYRALIQCLVASKQNQQANQEIDSILSTTSSPLIAEAYYCRGAMQIQLQDVKDALDPLKKAVEIDPNVTTYHTGLAYAYWSNHEASPEYLELTKSEFEMSLKLDPYNSFVQYQYAMILIEMQQKVEAEKHLHLAIDFATKEADIIEYKRILVRLLRQRQDFGAAAKILREVVKSEGQNPEAVAELAVTLADLGDFAEAKKNMQMAVKLAPNHFTYKSYLAMIMYSNGDKEQAVSQLKQAVNAHPMESSKPNQKGNKCSKVDGGEKWHFVVLVELPFGYVFLMICN